MSHVILNDDPKVFDVRNIPCNVKHRQILERWVALPVNDYFILKNDHDPVPLRYQFEAEFPGDFSWIHLEQGPETFQVKIQKLRQPADKTVNSFKTCGNH